MAKHTVVVTGWTLFTAGLSLALGLSLSFILSSPKDRLLEGDCVTWNVNLDTVTAERGIILDFAGTRKMIKSLSRELTYEFKNPDEVTRIPNRFCKEK